MVKIFNHAWAIGNIAFRVLIVIGTSDDVTLVLQYSGAQREIIGGVAQLAERPFCTR